MNRKNLTAAVLAGLAGAVGIVGSAQAVNINPDGLGEVLIYPYYTTNGGNVTLLSVVNTTSKAKAVKVRFLEGQNSREVLDFNLYMSKYDVWTAALVLAPSKDFAGTEVPMVPTMVTKDNSCTVPYIYGYNNLPAADGDGGSQEFLPWRLNDAYYNDISFPGEADLLGVPDGEMSEVYDDIARGAEGHFEIIEMGELLNDSTLNPDYVNEDVYTFCETGSPTVYGNPSDNCLGFSRPWTASELDEDKTVVTEGSAAAATHKNGVPKDCQQLVDAWTRNLDGEDDDEQGYWIQDDEIDIGENSGGLFGGAAVVNVAGGAMYSYDAKAIDGWAYKRCREEIIGVGFECTELDPAPNDDLHQEPGTILPSLDSGGNRFASVFVRGQTLDSINLDRGVDAVSFVFMHDQIMNEYTTESAVNAGTEWVITFPTKQFYVHQDFLDEYWNLRPHVGEGPDAAIDPFTTTWTWVNSTYVTDPDDPNYGMVDEAGYVDRPCEVVTLDLVRDREEQKFDAPDAPDGDPIPPIVSPAPPGEPVTVPGEEPFQLCFETSVIAFGPVGDTGESDILGSKNFHNFDTEALGFESGWARLNLVNYWEVNDDNEIIGEEMQRNALGGSWLADDWGGLEGLPVTGFAVQRFDNGFLGEAADVMASYGGIFQHKGTRKVSSGND
jgi:hypothetical protein